MHSRTFSVTSQRKLGRSIIICSGQYYLRKPDFKGYHRLRTVIRKFSKIVGLFVFHIGGWPVDHSVKLVKGWII